MSFVTLEGQRVAHAAEQALKIVDKDLELTKKEFTDSFSKSARDHDKLGFWKRAFSKPTLDEPTLDKLAKKYMILERKRFILNQLQSIASLNVPVTLGALEADCIKDYLGDGNE